jgi:hypothetical protein
LLVPLVEGAMLEKSLDVVPAKRLLGKKPSLLLGLKVVPKARYKQNSVYSPDLFTPVARSSSWRLVSANPCFQKTGIAFSNTSSRLKLFGRPMAILFNKEPNSSIFLYPRRSIVIV